MTIDAARTLVGVITSRIEVLRRAGTLWPLGTVGYSQSGLRDGYRRDCSGYVSMVLGIPASAGWDGESTVTLLTDGWVYPITRDQLQPGDLIGALGPGTDGDAGHVVIFERWIDDNRTAYYGYEQAGGVNGPLHRRIGYPYDGNPGFLPYRPAQFDAPTPSGDDTMKFLVQHAGDPAVYVADGIVRRWVRNEADLANLRLQATNGTMQIWGNGQIVLVDTPEQLADWGVLLGDSPDSPPHSPPDDAQLAAQALSAVRELGAVILADVG
jgi:hypothetical protein